VTLAVLLPPSETKADGSNAEPVDFDALAFPELAATRRKVAEALVRLSTGRQATALAALGITARQAHELERNAELLTAATAPAREVYTGVLFDHVGFATLTPAARKRADAMCMVQSALYGLVALGDRIAPYRLSAGSSLPRMKTLPSLWTPLCTPLIAGLADVVVDLRSGSYAGMGALPADGRHIVPRVMQHMPAGPPKVVSHSNKATKGRLLREVLTSGKPPASPEALAELASGLGDVDLALVRGVWRLDVVVRTL
jgi:cytoplasmic iron level regulating protein YaaA (DUF328/UPF0246 family)